MTLSIPHLHGIDLIEMCDPFRVLLDLLRELREPLQVVLLDPASEFASEFVLIGQCIHSYTRQAHVCTHCDECGAHSDERSNYATCAYFKPLKFYLSELCGCLLEFLAVPLAHELCLGELCQNSLSISLLRSKPPNHFHYRVTRGCTEMLVE